VYLISRRSTAIIDHLAIKYVFNVKVLVDYFIRYLNIYNSDSSLPETVVKVRGLISSVLSKSLCSKVIETCP